MALEQFLPEGTEWDIPILDGPSQFAITRHVTNLLATGYQSDDSKVTFTVVIDGVQVKAFMLEPGIRGAYAETDRNLEKPIVRVDGELCYRPGTMLYVPVSGLFSIGEHEGGFLVTGDVRESHFGYHFK
ncbi:hypothetical protein KKH05_00355 [Patescibacteria group bacterium]|nr:hypothetical protein [Patescibacteria group bacterium]